MAMFLVLVRKMLLVHRPPAGTSRNHQHWGGRCRHVLTNISYYFDQVVKCFPKNIVDGGGGGGRGRRNVKKIFRTNISSVKKIFSN